jgi:hypothetical protein
MDDASLDEFLDDSGSGGDESEAGGEGVTPTVSVYEFSPDGAPCAACGDEVVRRWRDDGVLVCQDCKRWGD